MSELQMNKDFVLRRVCGLNVVLPTGANVKDFGGDGCRPCGGV